MSSGLEVDGGRFGKRRVALPEERNSLQPACSSTPRRYLVNASGGKGTGGVYRTLTAARRGARSARWRQTAAPLVASDGSVYWMLMYDRGVIRSTNQGRRGRKFVDLA